tara:strand:+ start:1866 stop:2066 length:201 start_codon:yes stop_codon:yes gene_type:complete
MVYEHYDRKIQSLSRRLDILEKEMNSLRNEIQEQTIGKNPYNTSSTVSQDTIDIDMDKDFGQQGFV